MKVADNQLQDSANGKYIIYGASVFKTATGEQHNAFVPGQVPNDALDRNYETYLVYKVNKNLNYHIIVSPVLGEGQDQYVDIGFAYYTNGEAVGQLFERVKKERLYLNDNTFYEIAYLSNKFSLILTDGMFLRAMGTANKNALIFKRGYVFP